MTDNRRLRLMDLAAACLLFVIAVGLFFTPLTEASTLLYGGDITYFFPHEVVIDHSFAQSNFPLWNPYFGAGSPSLSKIQVGLLYPPMILLRLLLPVVARLNWDVVLSVFMAGLGVYWLTRDLVTNRVAALFSALAFMLSGAIIPRVYAGHESVLHAIVWIGWLLFAYRRMLHLRSWWYLLLTVIFASFVVLGGHPQMSAIVLVVPVSYFSFVYTVECLRGRRWPELARGLGLSAMAASLAAGLTAIQVLPFAEWLTYTARGSGEAFDSFEIMTRHSLQLHHLTTVAMPLAWFNPDSAESINLFSKWHFWEVSPFCGVVSVVMIVISLLVVRSQNWHLVTYFLGMALFALAMSMGTYNPLYPILLDRLPYIRAPGRFLLLWTFPVATLAGVSFDRLLRLLSTSDNRAQFKRPAYALTIVSIVTIATAVWLTAGNGVIATELVARGYLVAGQLELVRDLLQHSVLILTVTLIGISALFWLALIPEIKPRIWSWLAVTVLLSEVILFAQPMVQAYPVENLFDAQNPLAKLEVDPATARIDGYRMPPNYLVPTLDHVRNGEEHIALQNLLRDREKGRRLLSASYFATVQPKDDANLELVQQGDSAYLYRDVRTSPRLYASESITITHSDEEAYGIVMMDSFNQFEESVITLSREEESGASKELERVTALAGEVNFSGEWIVYSNDQIMVQVSVDRPALIIFGELYYPGWLATVDGQPASIVETNYAFRGVPVVEGQHIVEMHFSPLAFRLGAVTSATTLVLIIAISFRYVARLMTLRAKRGASTINTRD